MVLDDAKSVETTPIKSRFLEFADEETRTTVVGFWNKPYFFGLSIHSRCSCALFLPWQGNAVSIRIRLLSTLRLLFFEPCHFFRYLRHFSAYSGRTQIKMNPVRVTYRVRIVFRCFYAISLIQNDTPTREMLPLKMRILSMFSERNHLQSLFLIR